LRDKPYLSAAPKKYTMIEKPVSAKHPRGLYVLFFTEMWERFGFYLMIGILP
jgi:dipeptide/tripeptide permease